MVPVNPYQAAAMSTQHLPEGYQSRLIEDIRKVEDNYLVALHAFAAELKAESRPGEPATPLEELTIGIRKLPSEIEPWTCAITETSSGQLVAQASCGVERTGDNEHLFWTEIEVLPDHRRKGIGRWLLAQATAAAEAAGTEILTGWSTSAVPAAGKFAGWVEAEARQVNRESELDLTKVDWDMVDRWVAEGPRRAPGYGLELTEGVYPESHYDDVIAWWDIMNTAPRDELDWNDDHLTKERLAEWEAKFAASSTDRWELIARHLDSGACVGVTNAWFSPWKPEIINQGDTGVHPDHRGHALGKWLKAAMLQKIRDERPQAKIVRTGNAYSNDAMLGINNALGFYESRADTVWQLPVEKARKLLF